MRLDVRERVGQGAGPAESRRACVAMPTGQVLVWHLRIMMQPMVISGAVANLRALCKSALAMHHTPTLHEIFLGTSGTNLSVAYVLLVNADPAYVLTGATLCTYHSCAL